MSRYRGPKVKISRRLGLLPGLTTKKSKTYPEIRCSTNIRYILFNITNLLC